MLDIDNLTQQEQISCLDKFIHEINKQLDELTEGRDIPREIRALKLRIKILTDENNPNFKDKIVELSGTLERLEQVWKDKEPIINSLQEERALYRNVLNAI